MTVEGLKDLAKKTEPVNREAYDAVIRHWDSIAKPLDGLGMFERLTARIGSIQGREDISVKNKSLLLFLSDNGVVEEGVSQCDSEVTHKVGQAMAQGLSTVCMMAERAGVSVHPVDIGMKGDHIEGIIDKRIRDGSRNFAKEPAMTIDETLEAIETGYEEAIRLYKEGTDILLLGEMGIGNTTTSTAVACAILKLDPTQMTGRGAGLDIEQSQHKGRVIENALRKYDLCQDDIIGILTTFGGYDIAAMTGAIAGGAHCHMPLVTDGLITLCAALTAEKLFPGTKDHCIASHVPKEPMGAHILKELGLFAPIDAGMALGEGTGGVLLMPLLDVCLSLYDKGLPFEGLKMDPYKRFDG
ncbi:MAG: nicotinate-nucleotide--dimethylbenzimidazole phosphoribosyltransferase [Lachnospiraceae bacterium]|nr:nicotinate-nucleotide--dimethylbenzimidazole phosphoribosyltransferase [Lachnospiraceae bacterium]